MIRRPLASFKSLNGGDNSPATLRNRRKCWEQLKGIRSSAGNSLPGQISLTGIIMADWQPIETAPRDGTKVDLWVIFENGGHRVADATWSGDEENGWKLDGFTQYQYTTWPDATHWMPLPEPPK